MKIDLGPITRIEGHLNIKTTVDNGVVTDARCMAEMFRGFELFLRGRDPLDAQQITQRICGVCPYAHAIASSYAQEAAYGITAPANGRILHNLIQGANHLYDYLLHFYQLAALDFIDVTAITGYNGSDRDLLQLKAWVQAELQRPKPFPAAPFLPRPQGRYLEDQDFNVGALKHYLQAMEMERKANRAAALFGGKFPHAAAIFPGGCTQEARIDLIATYQELIKEVREFIHRVYIPDVVAVAQAFPEYWEIGRSQGGFLSFGLLPTTPDVHGDRLLAGGVLLDGSVSRVAVEAITQETRYSRYQGDSAKGITTSATVPMADKAGAYSWAKAPRYRGRMVEVGPAARVLVDYSQGHNPDLTSLVDRYTTAVGVEAGALNSVLGRHLSRALLAAVIADFLLAESDRLDPAAPTMADITIPRQAEGVGLTEASRGALLHYLRIDGGKIAAYECIVPTTWNASPRDDRDQPGALESALIGTKVADPQEQLECLRIVHSFDPCIACAVH